MHFDWVETSWILSELQIIKDYLDSSLTAEVKSFKAEIGIIQNKYLHGNQDKWTALYISGEIIKMYNKLSEDGTSGSMR